MCFVEAPEAALSMRRLNCPRCILSPMQTAELPDRFFIVSEFEPQVDADEKNWLS